MKFVQACHTFKEKNYPIIGENCRAEIQTWKALGSCRRLNFFLLFSFLPTYNIHRFWPSADILKLDFFAWSEFSFIKCFAKLCAEIAI